VQDAAEKMSRRGPLTILITAGPTVEDIDPVRFISNRATGKLGVALARAALSKGHRVILIHGPISEMVLKTIPRSKQLSIVAVRSAADMLTAVMKNLAKADVVVMNAAVADFTPADVSGVKLKKASSGLVLRLKPTVDILKALGQKKSRGGKFALIGFALETGSGKTAAQRRVARVREAQRKLRDKNLDAIVLDTPHAMGAEASDFTVISRDESVRQFRAMTKTDFAKVLVALAQSVVK
jgi:phosphopantothenoylcysteine decarboxylase/phosphopantothenate--cysteine ligase